MRFTTFFGEPFDRISGTLPKLFGPLDAELLRAIKERVEWLNLEGGETLFRQGEPGDALYIVAGGRLRAVVNNGSEEPRVIGEIVQGEPVGEMALLTGEPRSATVFAVRDSLLMRLDRGLFSEIVATNPDVLLAISRTLIKRLSATARPETPTEISNVAVVPLTEDAPTAEVAQRLTAALKSLGSTTHLTAASVDNRTQSRGWSQAPEAGPEHVRLAAWLDRQTLVHRFVVYEAEAAPSPWTRRCLRQADRVLLIANGSTDPAAVTAVWERDEHGELVGQAERELVLVHSEDQESPVETGRWYAHRSWTRHHHCRLALATDWQRLARSLAGTAVGIVFAGGGARGFAHIGVIRALSEAGIPLDLVGGTSMGAVIAATVATGWSIDELEAITRHVFTRTNPLDDYNLIPIVSLLKGRKIDRLLSSSFGNRDIEDLWLPFFCVSSNLTTAELALHRRGPAWKAVRASLSLPGVLPPVVFGNDLHVDGATFNNFPVNLMRSVGAGRIIAVDLDIRRSYDLGYDEVPSSWSVLLSRVLPWRRRHRVPSIISTIFKASALGGMQQRESARTATDLYLNPDVRHIGLLDLKAFDDCVEIGYRHAIERLETIDIDALR